MTKLLQSSTLKQTLKMTQAMQKSVSILQMSSFELSSFLSQELEKNPFLEDNSVSEEPNYLQENNLQQKRSNSEDFDLISSLSTEKTLKDYILEQIRAEISNAEEQNIAYYLLDLLQPSGYINYNIIEIIEDLKCSEPLICSVLSKLQKFDPPGIFARNLKECLIIQLNLKNINDQNLVTLIDNLELLAKNEFKKLEKICAVNDRELRELIKKIKKLNPKPANGFNSEQTIYKIPDVILTIEKDCTFKITINPESMPKIRFNDTLFIKIKSGIIDREGKIFTKTAVNDATGIIKAIENRANTILRVASAIIAEQIDFFNRGVMYLKPLTLIDVARITGLNESTISRSTANKYIQTPNGVFELKYFFSSGLSSTKHLVDAVSSIKVKEIIKQIIISEEQNNALSDDDIAYELEKFNIKIARRTVAKYRQESGFPTSAIRKKASILNK